MVIEKYEMGKKEKNSKKMYESFTSASKVSHRNAKHLRKDIVRPSHGKADSTFLGL